MHVTSLTTVRTAILSLLMLCSTGAALADGPEVDITAPGTDTKFAKSSNIGVTGTSNEPFAQIFVSVVDQDGVTIQSGTTQANSTGGWNLTLTPPIVVPPNGPVWPVGMLTIQANMDLAPTAEVEIQIVE